MHSRSIIARAAATVLLAATLGSLLVACGGSGSRHAETPGPGVSSSAGRTAGTTRAAQAELTIRAHEHVRRIPRSFLGFSTEYWTLPVDERHVALYERVLSMLHVTGDGRFVLRIGGDSSDHAVWDPANRRLPPWAFAVTPALVTRTARIVGQMWLRVIIDLNTFTSTVRLGADWARAAEARLPTRSIIGFEIGNEPDLYSRAQWVSELKHTTFDLARLPRTITPVSYARDYEAFARALGVAAPGAPLLAPALGNPARHIDWISTLLAKPHPGLRTISVHRYPYSACSRPGKPQFPTVEKLLSENATAGMADSVKPAVSLARRAAMPVRLTEINSVTCGGVRGVSNTFATALWAPDALFELVRAGVDAVNLHVRVFSINAPFYYDRRGLKARPLLYGLILFARMLGPHSRLVPARLRSPRALHLKAWAVRVGSDRLNVLLINKGHRSVTVNLHLPASGPAAVQRLLAPTAAADSGVRLGGQRLDDQAAWMGTPRTQTVTPSAGVYSIRVRRQSAAMLTVSVAPNTLGG